MENRIGDEMGDWIGTVSLERQEGREEDTLLNFLKNSCMNCKKDFGRDEVRVLPSSYIQNRDFYVKSGIVEKRLLCVGCYNSIRKAERVARAKPYRRGGLRRVFSSRGFLSDLLV